MAPLDAKDVMNVAALVFQDAISSVPVVGTVASVLFGLMWSKLTAPTPDGDVKKLMITLIDEVKEYIDQKLTYAKEQICADAIDFHASVSDDLKVQLPSLPDSADVAIRTHYMCVVKARDALHVLYDLEWGQLTIHNFATMTTLYLAALYDGTYDTGKWGIPQGLKDTYSDRFDRFFETNEFSKLLVASMEKAGRGNVKLRNLMISTTQVTNFWYCFNRKLYPLGIPLVLKPLDPNEEAPTNMTAGHVYFQPPKEHTQCNVNNMPGGYVRQVLAKNSESSTWHPYYTSRTGSILRLVSPDEAYPKTVEVRYYRLATESISKYIGLDYAIRISFSNGSSASVESAIPGEGEWKGSTVFFHTEAVVLNSDNPNSNIHLRGVTDKAKLEYILLGTLQLDGPCDVHLEWKPTSSKARSLVLLSAVELLVKPESAPSA